MVSIAEHLSQLILGLGGMLDQAHEAPAAATHTATAAHAAAAAVTPGPAMAALIPLLPLIGAALTTLCAVLKVRTKLPAFLTVGLLAIGFGITVNTWLGLGAATQVTHAMDWFNLSWGDKPGQQFIAGFGFYLDSLTMLWMLFVMGLGTLIALYASEYMGHDVGTGYCRFFTAFNLFVFSMAMLVMGDSLLSLFLGWEGVGLCSYLLIGYFYQRPAARDAAKKAFIMNRIGDLGLLMGLMTTFCVFGTIEYAKLFPMVQAGIDGNGHHIAEWVKWVVPGLLTVGAFGKSAQLFFYVWLPDAMEGPTPVSALIHAATMVTAGVYLIARMYPLYLLDDARFILTGVAWSGAITAFWAATIGMAHFDIKRIMGYSTVSQLGYMFAGLGVMTSYGAAFHVFTHAFFKATLFLCCGAVMHGFRGQLDLRKLSGVMSMKGWGLVGLAMLVGCLNLSGFPFTAGFFSKDAILAQAFASPQGAIGGSQAIGWLLLLTAGMTAYYTFRVFFRVFVGPQSYEPGNEEPSPHGYHAAHAAHGDGHGHGDAAHGHAEAHGHTADHAGHAAGHDEHFHPHAPGWAVNLVLGILLVSTIAAAGVYFIPAPNGAHGGWVAGMVDQSTARLVEHAPAAGAGAEHAAAAGEHAAEGHGHGTFLGMDPHAVMYYVSAVVGLLGIGIAFLLHKAGRTAAATSPGADKLAAVPALAPLIIGARNRWWVDEIYNFLVRVPLLVISHIFHIFDKLLVDGLVNTVGRLPRFAGGGFRTGQSGVLHGYAVSMATGIALIVLLAFLLMY